MFTWPFQIIIRELKQTTTTTATRTSQNKRFNEQNSRFSRALYFLVHFTWLFTCVVILGIFHVPYHVRYIPSFISLPSSAKQQREMAKFCAATANLSHLELNPGVTYSAWTSSDTIPLGARNRFKQLRNLKVNMNWIHFLLGVVRGVAAAIA